LISGGTSTVIFADGPAAIVASNASHDQFKIRAFTTYLPVGGNSITEMRTEG